MNTLKTFFIDLRDDEDGASFLEYTVLLGIILAVTIGTIVLVGEWARDVWVGLESELTTSGIGGNGNGD